MAQIIIFFRWFLAASGGEKRAFGVMTIMSTNPNTSPSSNPKEQTNSQSPKSRRWRQSQVVTAMIAIVALLISTVAWLSLVFSDSSLSLKVSEDISRFQYTNPTGHSSGLRISRIISECFCLCLCLRLPKVRWFVLANDDTIINADNLVAVLSKYDTLEMVYVGRPLESHSANTYFSHSMAFGGGGIAISYPLAKALSEIQDARNSMEAMIDSMLALLSLGNL
ncbi:uncharacterized protein LOC133737438 [Rosa rugosa]|uniref:uncharacterized protein LOC133737438 n=1 Tax=Rosa rugosa TaxID=74645 RepID=UPI002B4046F8|nr:uncharacterized protein LOC133737438 [Rosa rugosa]